MRPLAGPVRHSQGVSSREIACITGIRCGGRDCLELGRREAAARAGADRLRTRIEELSEDLARAEEQASRLSIAREEVARVLEEPAVAEPPAGQNGKAGGKRGRPRRPGR